MKQPPKGSVFEVQQMTRVDFLRATLQRLQNEVGVIIGLIETHNHQAAIQRQRIIGFWAMLRMILPIIEAISHVMDVRPEQILQNELNIPTPYLAWHLFRHSLIHGDYLQHGRYQGKEVGWGVMFVGEGHIIQDGHVGIDLPTLYQDLVNYLQKEVARNDKTLVNVEVGIDYQNPGQSVIRDFDRL